MKEYIVFYFLGSLVNIFLFIIRTYNTRKFNKFLNELDNLTKFGYIDKRILNCIILFILVISSWLLLMYIIYSKLPLKK